MILSWTTALHQKLRTPVWTVHVCSKSSTPRVLHHLADPPSMSMCTTLSPILPVTYDLSGIGQTICFWSRTEVHQLVHSTLRTSPSKWPATCDQITLIWLCSGLDTQRSHPQTLSCDRFLQVFFVLTSNNSPEA